MASISTPLLGRLPAELRNDIYHLALDFATPINVKAEDYRIRMALPQTCKVIRREVTAMILGKTEFKIDIGIDHFSPLSRWLQALGPETVAFLTSLKISIGCSSASWQAVRAQDMARLPADRWNRLDKIEKTYCEFLDDLTETVLHSAIAMVTHIKAMPLKRGCLEFEVDETRTAPEHPASGVLPVRLRRLIPVIAECSREVTPAVASKREFIDPLWRWIWEFPKTSIEEQGLHKTRGTSRKSYDRRAAAESQGWADMSANW